MHFVPLPCFTQLHHRDYLFPHPSSCNASPTETTRALWINCGPQLIGSPGRTGGIYFRFCKGCFLFSNYSFEIQLKFFENLADSIHGGEDPSGSLKTKHECSQQYYEFGERQLCHAACPDFRLAAEPLQPGHCRSKRRFDFCRFDFVWHHQRQSTIRFNLQWWFVITGSHQSRISNPRQCDFQQPD